jgi:hypothetical protein
MSPTPFLSLSARQRLSHGLLWVLLVAAAGSQAGLAQYHEPAGPRLTPAQQEKLFPERKALLLKEQKELMAILQKGERCTRAAANHASLRACMQEQRKAQQKLRQEQRQSMQALYSKYGITPPAAGKNKGASDKGNAS